MLAICRQTGDFGTMVGGRTGPAACANEIRGLIIGGSVPGQFKTDIDYFSMESGGQATDYGDLLQGVNNAAAASSSTRAFRIGGGQGSGNPKDMIRRMHFATLGEVIDFGDLTEQNPMLMQLQIQLVLLWLVEVWDLLHTVTNKNT